MNKFILIGKCFKSSLGGPSEIIRGIEQGLKKQDIEYESLLLSEECGKFRFVKKLLFNVFTSSECVINVHTYGFLIPFLVYICSLLNKKNKYYLTVHGIYAIDSLYSNNTNSFYVRLEKNIYKKFPNIICVSEMLKKSLKEYFDRDENVFVIPNGSDATEFCMKEKTNNKTDFFQIIMLGGIKNIKGIYESLELIDYLVKQKQIHLKYEIYGASDSETEKEKFTHKVLEKGLHNIVDYKGIVRDKSKIYSIIEKADFQLCLSQYDTFNVAIAESLILGCPCITSDKCGAAYLIKVKENGLVVDMKNKRGYEEIGEYIDSFVRDPDKRQRIFDAREKYREILSWDAVCMKYVELMKK